MKQDNLGFFSGLIFGLVLSALTIILALKLIKVATLDKELPVKRYDFKKVEFAFIKKGDEK